MLHMQFVHMLSPDYDHQLWFANVTGGVCWFVILLSLRQIEYVKVRWKKPLNKCFFVGHVLGQFDCTRRRNYCQLTQEGY